MKITEFKKLIREEVRKALKETYRDAKENVAIIHGMLKKGGNEAKYIKDLFKDIESELAIKMSLTDPKANLKLANKVPELDEYLDDAVESALDDGMGRVRGMSGGMQGMREEVRKAINEIGNTSNVHPWVLKAMEELKDDLDHYLGPKNQYAGSSIDFDLLKKKMLDLMKTIKQYT